MADAQLVSSCGIYCGACYIYRAERDGGALLDELSKKFGLPRDRIRCNGCSSPHAEQWVNCQDCDFKQCHRRRGIKNCAQCGEFETCTPYEGAVKFTEYRGEDIREGVRRVEAGEGEAWLREQERYWSCLGCGRPLMWYDNNCRGCGKKVKGTPVSWKPALPKS